MRKKIEVVAGIYRITNLITGCVYIGSSKDLYKRLSRYEQPKCNVTKDIKESILTYGIDNHEIKIICEFDSDISVKELHTYEDSFILLYVNRLGEDKVFNSYCNDKKKFMSKRYKLTQKNNGYHGMFGINHIRSKKINQYTKDNVFVKTWDSMMDVERELGYNNSYISSVCTGKRNQAYGFKWLYYNEKES